MGLRITLINAPSSDGWRGPAGLFQEAARALSSQGHDVQPVDVATLTKLAQAPPLLTALNRAVAAQPMIDSHRLAHLLAQRPPDLIIAPLQGGIAQATLMARACGEGFSDTRIALWGNQPTRNRFLTSDAPEADLSPLIRDAMERQCLDLADALIVPDATVGALSLPDFNPRTPLIPCPRMAGAAKDAGTGVEIQEIVFVGALQRAAGAGEFVEAIERLSRGAIIGDRLVTFLGPMTDYAHGLSKEWLGQKAAAWPFRFRIVDERERAQALRYASGAGRLVVSISPDGDDLHWLRACNKNHVALMAQPMADSCLVTRLAESIAVALRGGGSTDDSLDDVDWAQLMKKLTPLRGHQQAWAMGSIAVCILHHNRLDFLRQAVASIPRQIDGQEVEIIVIDNASPIADIERAIREAAGDRPSLRILKLSEPLPQAAAYNRGLAEANSDVVAFLDDDNLFLADGLERLARAASNGAHDIVVTALDVFDGDHGAFAPSAGRMIFLGAAHSAGLFFNAFGDMAMAVRRETFVALGGIHEQGYNYPSLDWVTLAKAYGAGLRVGALQWPAVRYRRDTVRADQQAIKLDAAGARAMVFDAYRCSFDAVLVARYAQNLQLSEL